MVEYNFTGPKDMTEPILRDIVADLACISRTYAAQGKIVNASKIDRMMALAHDIFSREQSEREYLAERI